MTPPGPAPATRLEFEKHQLRRISQTLRVVLTESQEGLGSLEEAGLDRTVSVGSVGSEKRRETERRPGDEGKGQQRVEIQEKILIYLDYQTTVFSIFLMLHEA